MFSNYPTLETILGRDRVARLGLNDGPPERSTEPVVTTRLRESGVPPRSTVPLSSVDRAELLALADEFESMPPVDVQPDRAGRQRLRVWSTDALLDLGVEPGAVRFTRAGLRLRTDEEIQEYGTEGLEELLGQFPLTRLERAVAMYVLDGREPDRGYMTEVAEAVGISPGSARVHWSNAKRKMSAILESAVS